MNSSKAAAAAKNTSGPRIAMAARIPRPQFANQLRDLPGSPQRKWPPLLAAKFNNAEEETQLARSWNPTAERCRGSLSPTHHPGQRDQNCRDAHFNWRLQTQGAMN